MGRALHGQEAAQLSPSNTIDLERTLREFWGISCVGCCYIGRGVLELCHDLIALNSATSLWQGP